MKIVIANDHVALDMKKIIIEHLKSRGHEILNIGTDKNEPCEYPVYGKKAAEMVVKGEACLGILICGSGVGISIAANKIKGVRAVVCSEPYSAMISKQHNNTNILCFGARVIGSELAKMIVDAWLDAEFEGGRHAQRVEMIKAMEEAGE